MRVRFLARMVTVVRPHKAPAARPSRSPKALWVALLFRLLLPLPLLPAPKPSRMAKATATKAQAMPSHCSGRRRSDLTNSGTSAATQNGEV